MLHKLILAALVLTSTIATGCNDTDTPSDPQAAGELSLRVKVGAVEIDSIQYEIVHATRPTLAGDIDVSGADTASFQRSGIPVDTGYTLVLKAETTDGLQECAGTSPTFDIHPAALTSVKVDLNCKDKELPDTDTTETDTSTDTGTETETSTAGNLDVEVVPNQYPRIAALAASPDETGTTFVFTAMVSDVDGDALSYLWQVDGLDISTAESSSYVCGVSGEHTVALQVSDAKVSVDDSLVFVCN